MKENITLVAESERSTSPNREHPVTELSIDQILGLSDKDQKREKTRFFFEECRSYSHCHPHSSRPINQLDAFALYIIIVNYTNDREKSKPEHYLQPDRNKSAINFLLDELSNAALLILMKDKNLPTQELGILATAIEDSHYLSSHPGMNKLSHLATEMWLKLDDESIPKNAIRDSQITPS